MRLLGLILLFLCAITAGQLSAATVVVQKVNSFIDGKSTSSTHTWTIDGKKFHLRTVTGANHTEYLFNGRNFYICSKLDRQQIAFLEKNNLKNPQLLEQFKDGACQVVPANFMVRFFLSPTTAVESINRSDGLRLTLGLENYNLTKIPGSKAIHAQRCGWHERKYKLTKSGGQTATGKTLHLKSDTSEKLCIADTINWRSGFIREVTKTVMRQPKGTSLLTPLRKDSAGVRGLALAIENTIVFTDSKGGVHNGKRTVSTTSVRKRRVPARQFRLPAGYNLFSPETISLAAKEISSGDKTKKKGADPDDAASLFLCALAGPLGCLFY